MERTVRVGDLAMVKVGNQDYPLSISKTSPGRIWAGDYQIVLKGSQWQVEGYSHTHSISWKRSSLRIASANLAYHIMDNQVAGSEASQVKKCQETYPGGWVDSSHTISSCTYNAAKLLTSYNLFGLQEVHPNYSQKFQELLRSVNPDYRFISGRGIMTGYDHSITGEGIPLTPSDYLLVSRGMQVIWFPKLGLLFINLHAPHDINLKKEIEKNLSQIQATPTKVIIVGDFNDYKGALLNQTIDGFGFQMKVPLEKRVLTCCADSGYQYPGDYILTSHYDGEYYGHPKGYVRNNPPISDHDPIVLIPGTNVYTGVVSITTGGHTEVLLEELDSDKLFRQAQDYVKEKNLGWNIGRLRAWTKPDTGPHVSLVPAVRQYLGDTVQVKLGKITHFIADKTRWVVYDVELSPKFNCGYPCHLSIGQERMD